MSDPQKIVEQRDALAHLRARGFAPLLEALQDPSCQPTIGPTAGGISVRAVARRMRVSAHTVNTMLAEARAAIG